MTPSPKCATCRGAGRGRRGLACRCSKPCSTCGNEERSLHGNCLPCTRTPEARRKKGMSTSRKRRLVPALLRAKKREWQYGLTQAAWDSMFDAQGGKCPVCEKPLTASAATDHIHGTTFVRGLLCRVCNAGIGSLGDDAAGLRRALAYVEDGEARYAAATRAA